MLFRGKEIYPSIVMPAGVATLKFDGSEIAFKRTQLYAYDSLSKTVKPLKNAKFTSPIPSQYLKKVGYNDFGLKQGTSNSSKGFGDWWRAKLREQGCSDSLFLLRETKLSVPSMSEEIINEKKYQLY
ncbi:MAG: hypothetical protein JXR03_09045 [Cyclobacteriaceae bacterium]